SGAPGRDGRAGGSEGHGGEDVVRRACDRDMVGAPRCAVAFDDVGDQSESGRDVLLRLVPRPTDVFGGAEGGRAESFEVAHAVSVRAGSAARAEGVAARAASAMRRSTARVPSGERGSALCGVELMSPKVACAER